ncbi:hypothetical protein M422DRAFT_261257 [Sphaerobolus stellatus SS14]|uniref:Tr-type G domain-containing protein n=1 Tax=Sphaerobolus stellatus (strain SS14) TaxID=990650 RepID=A0A0C9VFY2_SPHS4|nr:hypothetical protein M422DRAFT_261257 [Sphaerobolus stellatus SS14]
MNNLNPNAAVFIPSAGKKTGGEGPTCQRRLPRTAQQLSVDALPSGSDEPVTLVNVPAGTVIERSSASASRTKGRLDISAKGTTSVNGTKPLAPETVRKNDSDTLQNLFGKEHLNIVFIGHVDSGKSTMGGHLLYLTGMVDKRTLEKYEQEARELDSTTQERSKGKTVEVGRAYFETKQRRYTILDAPGHKSYVPSMIGGAAQADIGILVISARKGEFETGFEKAGQTREHIMLVKTVGISKVIVAVNKMDDPTVKWDNARYEEIKDKLIPFLRAAGFDPVKDVYFVPVSAYTGQNLKDCITTTQGKWWR